MTKKIFLGGTANNSNWREQLIPLLDSTKISYFNPVEQIKMKLPSKEKSKKNRPLTFACMLSLNKC